MLTRLRFVLLFLFVGTAVWSQKGNHGFVVSGAATVPVYQKTKGFGFSLTYLYGIGRSAQLTLSAAAFKFKRNNTLEAVETKTRLIPVLLGYRQHIGRIFLEPKMGLGELGGRISGGGDDARPSVAAVFGGMGAGYRFGRWEAGIQFLTVHGIENSSAGLWHDKNFHNTVVFLGYHLTRR